MDTTASNSSTRRRARVGGASAEASTSSRNRSTRKDPSEELQNGEKEFSAGGAGDATIAGKDHQYFISGDFQNQKAQLSEAITTIKAWEHTGMSMSAIRNAAYTSDNLYLKNMAIYADNKKELREYTKEGESVLQGMNQVERTGTTDILKGLDNGKVMLAAVVYHQIPELNQSEFKTVGEVRAELKEIGRTDQANATMMAEMDASVGVSPSISPSTSGTLTVDATFEKGQELSQTVVLQANESMADATGRAIAGLVAQATEEKLSMSEIATLSVEDPAAGVVRTLVGPELDSSKVDLSTLQDAMVNDPEKLSQALKEANDGVATLHSESAAVGVPAPAEVVVADPVAGQQPASLTLSFQFDEQTVLEHSVQYDASKLSPQEALRDAIVEIADNAKALGINVAEVENIKVSDSTNQLNMAFEGTQVDGFRESLAQFTTNSENSLDASKIQVSEISSERAIAELTSQNPISTEGISVKEAEFSDFSSAQSSTSGWRTALQSLQEESAPTSTGTLGSWQAVESAMGASQEFKAIPVSDLIHEELSRLDMSPATLEKADAMAQVLNQVGNTIEADTHFVVHHSQDKPLMVMTDSEGLSAIVDKGDFVLSGELAKEMLNGIDSSVKEFKDQLPTLTENSTTLDVYQQLTDNTINRLKEEGVPSELMAALRESADTAQINVGVVPSANLTETFVADQINSRWGEGMSDAQVLRESVQDYAVLQDTALDQDTQRRLSESDFKDDRQKDTQNDRQQPEGSFTSSGHALEMEMSAE